MYHQVTINLLHQTVHTVFECREQPVYTYVLGVILCIGGMISYFPQYYSLIKSKQHKGISEMSLLFLNLGAVCLAANSFILNWWKFGCYTQCSFWLCSANFLSMFQIMVGWIMVIPLYLIFVRYKMRNSDRKALYDVLYICIYIIFILVMVIVGMTEKITNPDSTSFFKISAKGLGVLSAVFSCVVWIPQIVKLIKTKQQGTLSLLMFIMQTPGNAIIIMFQILYKQDWTTWFAYVVTLVEQLIIVIILIVFKYRTRNIPEIVFPENPESDEILVGRDFGNNFGNNGVDVNNGVGSPIQEEAELMDL